MRGFLLDEKGDIVIENGEIGLVSGNELVAQTVKTTMNTNKGEWFLNHDEGINYYAILGKGITDEMRLNQVQDALSQVDESLHVTEFDTQEDKKNRTSTISFTAKGDGDTIISVSETYGIETNENAADKLALANSTLTDYRTASERLARRIDGI